METVLKKPQTDEQVRWVIAQASNRKPGLKIPVTIAFGKPTNHVETIRNADVGRFTRATDGRVGINVNGKSFMSTSPLAGDATMKWLKRAEDSIQSRTDYGQPPASCTFRRCG